ncbi:lysozyme inhibitor LprI family protein [Defluviimonas sp. SAOS-178_SWC]|uniref:lysozyme inhibitor LprI family protein n=1 Tax=Defluviimonas sp. SAOS-178_SWC TaxID=3121287 RepID=UPI0032220607
MKWSQEPGGEQKTGNVAGPAPFACLGSALCAGLGTTFGAAAETQAPVDRSIVQSCYEHVLAGQDNGSCVGDAAEACEVTPPHSASTLDIAQCRTAEAEIWESLLNIIVEQKMREYDVSDSAATLPGWLPTRNAIVAEQDAWKAYRDARCNLIYVVNQGGSVKSIAKAECLLQMNAAHVFEFLDATWQFGGTEDMKGPPGLQIRSFPSQFGCE